MTNLLLAILVALTLVAATGATFAAVWARSSARKVDDFAGIVLPYLKKAEPHPTVAGLIAAADAAPEPAIVERATEPPLEQPAAPASPPRPAAPTAPEAEAHDPMDHGPTSPMAAPAGGDPRSVEPPETGPSRSVVRERDDAVRPAGCFAPYVAPPEPSAPDTLPPSSTTPTHAEAAEDRRARLWQLGQETERQRQLAERAAREKAETHRRLQPLTDEEAARPSVEVALDAQGFAPDRPSWEGATGIHDRAQVQALLRALPPGPVPIARVVPRGATLGRGEGGSGARPPPPSPVARAGVAPPAPPTPPRARRDPEVTQLSPGVTRHDPRAES